MNRYQELLAQARENPQSADYTALRMEFTHTAEYDPYNWDQETMAQIGQAEQHGDWEAVRSMALGLLEANYLDIKAHMKARLAYERLGQNEEAWHHYYFVLGLLDSIRASGDGRSLASAYQIIDRREAYAILEAEDYQILEQSQIEDQGHVFDQINTEHPSAGPQVFFFNIDLPVSWWKAHQEAAPAEGAPLPSSAAAAPAASAPVGTPAGAPMAASVGAPVAAPAGTPAPAPAPTPEIAAPAPLSQRMEEEGAPLPEREEIEEALRQFELKIDPDTGSTKVPASALSDQAKRYFGDLKQREDPLKIRRGGIVAPIFVLLLGLVFLIVLITQLFNGRPPTLGSLLVLAFFAFLTVMCLDWGLRRLLQKLRSPVGSFDYPGPFYLFRTSDDHVEGWPYLLLDLDRSSFIHNTQGNNYLNSAFEFDFGARQRLSIRFNSLNRAEEFLQRVLDRTRDVYLALVEGRVNDMEGLDLLSVPPKTKVKSKSTLKRLLVWAVAALILTIPLHFLHGYLSEENAWQEAMGINKSWSYETYINQYPSGRYIQQARQRIDDVTYQEAVAKSSASALRKYVKKFPQGQHIDKAHAEIKKLYDAAIQKYKQKAGRAASLQRMTRVLNHLKKVGKYSVYIQYIPKMEFSDSQNPGFAKKLKLALQLLKPSYKRTLKAKGKLKPAPMAPAFTESANRSREAYITTTLSGAFKSLIPEDILDFVEKRSPPPDAEVVFRIQYTIRRKYDDFDKLRLSRWVKRRLIRKYNITRPKDGDLTFPSIYVQTRTTRYRRRRYRYGRRRYNRRVKRPVRTLYGVQVDWNFSILIRGEKPDKIDLSSGAAKHIRLRSGQTSTYYAYKRMAESAFDSFGAQIQKEFGVKAGLESAMLRFVWEMPPRYRKKYLAYSVSERIQKVQELWNKLDRFVRKMPYRYKRQYRGLKPYRRRRQAIEHWDRLDRIYDKLSSRTKRRLRYMSPEKRRLYILNILARKR